MSRQPFDRKEFLTCKFNHEILVKDKTGKLSIRKYATSQAREAWLLAEKEGFTPIDSWATMPYVNP